VNKIFLTLTSAFFLLIAVGYRLWHINVQIKKKRLMKYIKKTKSQGTSIDSIPSSFDFLFLVHAYNWTFFYILIRGWMSTIKHNLYFKKPRESTSDENIMNNNSWYSLWLYRDSPKSVIKSLIRLLSVWRITFYVSVFSFCDIHSYDK
jgi:hypothetical protein